MSPQLVFGFVREMDKLMLESVGFDEVDLGSTLVPAQWRPVVSILSQHYPDAVIFFRNSGGVKCFFVAGKYSSTGEGAAKVHEMVAGFPLEMQRPGALVVGDMIGVEGFRMSVHTLISGANPFDAIGPNYDS